VTGTAAPRLDARSAEVFLLLQCVAASGVQPTDALEQASSRVTDWPRFVELSERHALLQLVTRQLSRVRTGCIPADVVSRLSEVARLGAVRGLQLTGQLVSIVQELDRRGIDAMPVKGPTLAALVYGDLSLRLYEDLDILVHRADLDSARIALVALGYREAKTFNDARDDLIPETHHQAFVHVESGTPVELHWSLTHRTLMRESLEQQWWERRRELSLGGANIRTLGSESLVLYLCMHGAKHSWARIGWLADLNQTLRKFAPIDWDCVWRMARDGGASRMVAVGLLLIEGMLDGKDVASSAFASRKADRGSREIANGIRNRLMMSPDVLPSVDFTMQLRLRDGWRDRARYAMHILSEPWPADVSALRLPPGLRGAYYIFRPIRLASKYLVHRGVLSRAA